MQHGGDIYHHQVNMDFSVNVNPLGVPQSVLDQIHRSVERIGTYPEYTAEGLRKRLGEHLQLIPEQILCGNGASELLMACLRGLCLGMRQAHIILPVPSFYGYLWAAESIGAEVHIYPMKQECGFQLDDGFRDYVEEVYQLVCKERIDNQDSSCNYASDRGASVIIYLGNPNNPTGACLDPELLNGLLTYTQAHRIPVILDECFMELSDDPDGHSMIPHIQDYQNLWIIRAFTKTYAIPGIRLGYLVGSDLRKLSVIRSQLPEWNVSLPAQEAGISALRETGYPEQSRSYIRQEREYLRSELIKQGFWPFQSSHRKEHNPGEQALGKGILYPSVVNYLLIQSSVPLYDRLLEQGILIRDCKNYDGLSEGYYRIAVRTHEENAKLVEAIAFSSDIATAYSVGKTCNVKYMKETLI